MVSLWTRFSIFKLRSGIHLASRNIHRAHFGTDNISSLEPKLWKPEKINRRNYNMPQHYQLLEPRLNLGSSTTAHVDYTKYLLKILVLLKFVRVSNGIHISAYSFFLKKWGKKFKRTLIALRFFTQLDL